MTITTSTQNAFKDYFLDVKPYHSKLLEILEHYTFKDNLNVSVRESFLADENLINLPLCSTVGWGVTYDSSCGFDSISCCDLFTCVGGYGIIFDNSDLTETDNILQVNGPVGAIEISGNHTFDTRKQINGVLSKTSISITGNQLATIPTSGLFLIIPYKTLSIAGITSNQLVVDGNYKIEFTQQSEFLIIDSDGNDGIWYVAAATYDAGLHQTFVTINTDSATLLTSSLNGIIQVGSNTKNNGIYMILSATFNGVDTIIETNPDVKEFDLAFNDVGSAIFHTGYSQNRTVTIKNNAVNNNDDYVILYSSFNRITNITTIYVNSTIPESTGGLGTTNLYGYLTGPGFDGDKQCTIPKESNTEVFFSENVKFTMENKLKYSTLVLSDGPVGFWPLNELSGTTAFDISGNNNNGVYGGSTLATLNSPATNNDWTSSAHFTTGANVIIPAAQILNVSSVVTPEFTIEVWLNINSSTDLNNFVGNPNIFGKAYPINNAIPFGLGTTAPMLSDSRSLGAFGTIGITLSTEFDSTIINQFDMASLNIGTSVYAVAVFKNQKYYIYMNGMLIFVSNVFNTALPTTNISPLYIGNIPSNATNGFAGTLGDIALYNYALTDVQILHHFNAGKLYIRYDIPFPLPTPSPTPTITLTPTPSVTPTAPSIIQAGTSGVFAGGTTSSWSTAAASTVYTYTSNVTVSGGSLTSPNSYGAATANSIAGIFVFGSNNSSSINITNIYNFASNIARIGSYLLFDIVQFSGVGNSILGIFGGGQDNNNYVSNYTNIYYYSSNIISAGRNLSYVTSGGAAIGNTINGIFVGGGDKWTTPQSITSIYSYQNNTTVAGGSLSAGIYKCAGIGNTMAGVIGGGVLVGGSGSSITDIYNYNTNTVVTGGNLSFSNYWLSAIGNSSEGVFGGGIDSNLAITANTTNIYNYSSNTAIAGGLLTIITGGASGCGSNPGVNA